MPLPCAAGEPKAGVDPLVAISGASLAGFIEHKLGPRAIPFAAALGYISFQMPAFCQAGPPAFYQLTAGDYANLVLESLGVASDDGTVISKLEQVLQYYAWYDLCQCTDVATPPPQVSVEPTGAPSPNVTQGPPPNSPCIDMTRGVNIRDGAFIDPIVGDNRNVQDLTSGFFSSAVLTTVTDTILNGHPSVTAVQLPTPKPRSITLTTSNFAPNSGSCFYGAYMRIYNAAGTVTTAYAGQVSSTPNPQPGNTFTYTFGANDDHFTLYAEGHTLCTGGGFELHAVMDCGNGNAIAQECCPPDAYSQTILINILNKINNLSTSTGGGPISWHDGASHNNLRGAGSFLIDAHAIGVRFQVTTPPAGVQVDPGNPDFYWDMGFWSPYALGSPLRGGRLVFLNQSVQLPEFTDQIGFTLKHGTVMNAVELLPTNS